MDRKTTPFLSAPKITKESNAEKVKNLVFEIGRKLLAAGRIAILLIGLFPVYVGIYAFTNYFAGPISFEPTGEPPYLYHFGEEETVIEFTLGNDIDDTFWLSASRGRELQLLLQSISKGGNQ